MRHSEHRRIDVEQGEVADAIDTLKRMLQDLQNNMGPESLDVQTLKRSILSSIAELETLHLS